MSDCVRAAGEKLACRADVGRQVSLRRRAWVTPACWSFYPLIREISRGHSLGEANPRECRYPVGAYPPPATNPLAPAQSRPRQFRQESSRIALRFSANQGSVSTWVNGFRDPIEVLVDLFLPKESSLLHLGIHPHDVRSLVNILFAPFLHDGFVHVFTNTIGFVLLGWLVLVRSSRHFLLVSIVSAVVSGLGTWVFGAPGTVHVGASGVIFGYLGFLLMWGYFERSLKSFVLALIVAIMFGGMIWGVLPLSTGVSWQGHLFGLLGGGLAARFLTFHLVKNKRDASIFQSAIV